MAAENGLTASNTAFTLEDHILMVFFLKGHGMLGREDGLYAAVSFRIIVTPKFHTYTAESSIG